MRSLRWLGLMAGLGLVATACADNPASVATGVDATGVSMTVIVSPPLTWEVQSDYFGERDAVAQTRTIRSMALSHDGASVYTGNIQSPNVGTNALRKVSSEVLAIAGTDHVIFGNGMPGGTSGFGQVGGQPVYAGGATGKFQGWIQTANSPRGMATDDRGNVYAALSSGISPANQVRIYNSGLTAQVGAFSVTGPTGVAIHKVGATYYAYVAAGTLLRRWDVTNVAVPVLDVAWLPPVFSDAAGLTVDADGTVFLAGGGVVRRIAADGSAVTHTSASIPAAADVAVFQDKVYVIRQTNLGAPNFVAPIVVLNKSDLTSGGADIVVPDLNASRPRGTLTQFTAIDIGANGRIYVSEENYTAGASGIPSYTPPATSFNPTPGTITGRIYFDRVLVSSSLAQPAVAVMDLQPNTISLSLTGIVTAYLFSTPTFDATATEVQNIRLRVVGGSGPGAPVMQRNSVYARTVRDYNNDSLPDVMLSFQRTALVAAGLSLSNTQMVLEDVTGTVLPFSATDPTPPTIVN
jgi:hypothetical protein